MSSFFEWKEHAYYTLELGSLEIPYGSMSEGLDKKKSQLQH